MKFLILILLFSFISTSSFAVDLEPWKVSKANNTALNLNPLRFTNRARCAADSNLPTKSAFLMVDSINPGKAFYRLSKSTGKDSDSETTKGIEKLRYTIIELTKIITKRLLSGDLPLIPAALDSRQDPLYWYLDACEGGDCFLLNKRLNHFWTKSKDELIEQKKVQEGDYLEEDSSDISCYYLKRFSPIQGHLLTSKPNKATINQIGQALSTHEDYLVSCNNIDQQKNLKVANYQIDLLKLNDKIWKKKGFEFWNSLKLYLNWAFRFSEEAKQLAAPYHQLMKSINLEENLLFVPNGCKSINAPACDSASLNQNSMREFAVINDKEVFKKDFTAQIANGVETDLIEKPIIDVNNDILNFLKPGSANKWAEDFKGRYTKTKGLLKLKFINAITNLKLIKNSLSEQEIRQELNVSLSKISEHPILKDEIYYLCTEYKVATEKDFSFLNDELNLLKEKTILDKQSREIGGESISTYLSYFRAISKEVASFCDETSNLELWQGGHPVKRDGFTSWYKELNSDHTIGIKTNITRTLSQKITPILTLSQAGKKPKSGEVICVDGANCARIILDSMFDLYSSIRYADTFLSSTKILAPALLNPYNERVACSVYDPYKKRRHAIYQFFYDIARAAAVSAFPTPVYVSTDIVDKKVVSFKTLMKNGKVTFDPQVDPIKFKQSLIADLGPLVGVPCAISISGDRSRPLRYYSLDGISVGSCRKKEEHDLIVNSSTNINSATTGNSQCIACAINLRTVVGAAASVTPVVRSGYILARGLWNLIKGLRDPHNIPRSWNVDLTQTYHSYRKNGDISKSCFRKLMRGDSCLDNICEEAVAQGVEKYLHGGIEAAQIRQRIGNGFIKLTTCTDPIEVNLKRNRRRICQTESGIQAQDFIIPSGCHIRKKQ